MSPPNSPPKDIRPQRGWLKLQWLAVIKNTGNRWSTLLLVVACGALVKIVCTHILSVAKNWPLLSSSPIIFFSFFKVQSTPQYFSRTFYYVLRSALSLRFDQRSLTVLQVIFLCYVSFGDGSLDLSLTCLLLGFLTYLSFFELTCSSRSHLFYSLSLKMFQELATLCLHVFTSLAYRINGKWKCGDQVTSRHLMATYSVHFFLGVGDWSQGLYTLVECPTTEVHAPPQCVFQCLFS